ncbi:UBX domain protein Ubx2, partial [Spiromyces aspiralis]
MAHNNDSNLDELVSSFIEITGANHETALQYINFFGDCQSAVETFFNRNGAPLTDTDIVAGDANIDQSEDAVRAPIAARRERLIDTNDYGSRYYSELASAATAPTDPFVASSNDSWSRLFSVPPGLAFTAGFDKAQEKGEDENRLILIHFHDPDEFRSMEINRDFWNDKMICELIHNRLIFIQVVKRVDERDSLSNNYGIYSFPTIILVDPITGEKLLSFEKDARHGFGDCRELPNDPNTFKAELEEYIDARLIVGSPRKKRAKEKSIELLSEEEQFRLAIEASMNESGILAGTSAQPIVLDSDSDVSDSEKARRSEPKSAVLIESVGDGEVSGKAGTQLPPLIDASNDRPDLPTDAIDPEFQEYASLPAEYQEPGPGPATTRVKFHLPNGKTHIVRVLKSDKVVRLFSAAKSLFADTREYSEIPRMVANNMSLWERRDETVDSIGIANTVIR